jgi:hypothetical protein
VVGVRVVPDHPSGLRIETADLSKARPPRWAWLNRLPIGYLSLLIGIEGIGKSSLAAWLLSKLTHGELPGHLLHRPVNVGLVGDEDSFHHVWVPRLHAAGADLARVKSIEPPEGGFLELRPDKDRLATAIDLEQVEFVYFDSLIDNLGADTNDWHGKDVREALQPLRAIARDLNVAVCGSLHPNKRGATFRELMAGSAAFNAISRSSLLLAQHPEEEDRKVLSRGKGNLSSAPAAVEFTIESHRFEANGHEFNVPKAIGFTDSDVSVDELLDRSGEKTNSHTKIAEAVEIIEALLPRDGEWHPAASIYEACEAEEIEKHTVGRAKRRLSLEQRRASAFPAPAEWRWEPLRTTHRTSDNGAVSVQSVVSTDTLCTQDTHNTQNSKNASPECVVSANGSVTRLPSFADGRS